jgi:dihydrofolate reductase
VIMGKLTYLSIPDRPLKDHQNIVVSSTLEPDPNIVIVPTLIAAIEASKSKLFVIGGQHIYEEAINLPNCKYIYITQVLSTFKTDTKFPNINPQSYELIETSEVHTYKGLQYKYLIYKRYATPEDMIIYRYTTNLFNKAKFESKYPNYSIQLDNNMLVPYNLPITWYIIGQISNHQTEDQDIVQTHTCFIWDNTSKQTKKVFNNFKASIEHIDLIKYKQDQVQIESGTEFNIFMSELSSYMQLDYYQINNTLVIGIKLAT